MQVELIPKKVLFVLVGIFLLLGVAHSISAILILLSDNPRVISVSTYFHFDMEKNIPSIFSGFILASASGFLFLVGSLHKKEKSSYLPWMSLAVIFLFLSFDEIASVHEQLITPVQLALDTTGLFFFAWIIPYGIATLLLGLAYLKFVIQLPKTTRLLFILSGALFVTGAVGFEMISGRHAEMYAGHNLPYVMMTTIEESLEMLGIIIFLYALTAYISTRFPAFSLTFVQEPSAASSIENSKID